MASDSNHARRSVRLSPAGASESEMALPARIQHFLGRMIFLPAGVMSDQPQMASGLYGRLAHLGDERKAAVDLGFDLARADARALGEDQDVLAALQRMLGGAQALHIGSTTLHGDAANAAKGPAHDLALGEL